MTLKRTLWVVVSLGCLGLAKAIGTLCVSRVDMRIVISKTLSELFPTFPHFLGSRKGRKALKEGPFLFRKADQRAAIARKAMKALKLRVEEASQNHTTFFFFFAKNQVLLGY